MRATTDALSFSLRFGLGRIVRPWIITREEVSRIRATDSEFILLIGVELYKNNGRLWRFWTMSPEAVLRCLQELGYPVILPTKELE